MKLGLSTYSLHKAIASGQMTVLQAIQWIADHGGEHVEIVPIGYQLTDNPELLVQIRDQAKACGIEISNYAVGGHVISTDAIAFDLEIERLCREVDIARQLGVRLMRHDVAWRPIPETGIAQFEQDLPRMVEACQRIADYAGQFGITTSVENHGYFVQASDRVQRLVALVNRPNYKTTIDVGNFLCADEDAVIAVKKNLPIASMVHLKDFYLRTSERLPGKGFFSTAGGNFLRGAILGHGDIDLYAVMRVIKASGYDGYLSVEFEGMEDCVAGSETSLENARRIWNEV